MGHGLEGALAHADAALLTNSIVNLQFAVYYLGGLGGTVFFNLTHGTAAAHIAVEDRHFMPFHAEVVQRGLHAAVGTAAHRNLELMGQLYTIPADIISLMNLFGQFLGVIVAIDAGGALTGHHRAHLGTGAAETHAPLRGPGTGLLNLVEGNAGDFHRQTTGADQLAVAKEGSQLAHVLKILR